MIPFVSGNTVLDGRSLSALLFLLSLAVIATGWGFELIGGYKPCPLCLQERYAYYLALPAALGAFYFVSNSKSRIALLLLGLCALAFLINSGLGVYHSGVEWRWWPGPSSCTGAGALDTQAGSLVKNLSETHVIRCDEAPWRFLGLSFAGYNALISLGLAGLALLGVRSVRTAARS
jgi:disulfide bond formation protein DsbB